MNECDLDILTRSCKLDRLILVVKNQADLGRESRWLNLYFVTDCDGALLNFAVSNNTLLFNLVEDGHAQR